MLIDMVVIEFLKFLWETKAGSDGRGKIID